MNIYKEIGLSEGIDQKMIQKAIKHKKLVNELEIVDSSSSHGAFQSGFGQIQRRSSRICCPQNKQLDLYKKRKIQVLRIDDGKKVSKRNHQMGDK